MPELDGETLERRATSRARADHSASPSAEQLERLRPGIDGFQRKPASGPELAALVEAC